ncbi:MAG: PEP-utilizing enzyme [Solirubrobacteraceae bacterium]
MFGDSPTNGLEDKAWVVDDEPHGRFSLYTRGNVGEVYPDVVSPLTWSVLGCEAERGWRAAFARLGVLREDDFGDSAMGILGVFGGYCYLNAAYIRVFAVRTPGLSPTDMDREFFGESSAPPYRSQPGDSSAVASMRVGWRLLATLSATALPGLEEDKHAVAAWLDGLPSPASCCEDALMRALAGFRPLFRRLFFSLMLTTFQASVGPGLLDRLCAEKLSDPTVTNKLLTGIGSVESAAPAYAMWQLGRLAQATPAVAATFESGLDDLHRRLVATPAAADFNRQFGVFLERFGFRGPNEWEGASPTWASMPALALAAIDRMRVAPSEYAPQGRHERLQRERQQTTIAVRARLRGASRFQFDRALRAAHLYSQGRERAKTTIVRAIDGLRVVVAELGRRARDRGGPDDPPDVWLLTYHELGDYLADPDAFRTMLEERRVKRDRLGALVPPFTFQGRQPAPQTWPRRDAQVSPAAPGMTLPGMPGCPGLARGRTRVVLDPGDPGDLGPGEVLIAPLAAPAWTPLFACAEAVVVDVGARLSHATIVARELGPPTVVSVSAATRKIPDGTMVEVDGDRGVVRILGL